ncbi:BolA family transcriptional regulator [Stagnimonas aquatica]|uniref:BolA family transcriptional regulator n=1 Tax=Stagnimonas aquatica TaxID=2689987 RepID=A0A3N0VEI3_9GAMM|nr:BolA family protein [Stagnimonas aquatica]ROH91101.1 BolA family transcriptional regulator [Stagnimonas aquatica]
MSAGRVARIESALRVAFPDADIEVQDDSAQHLGHAGAASGRGHFRVRLVSATFSGQPLLARHRAVYAALGELMQTDIHALAIEARPPA